MLAIGFVAWAASINSTVFVAVLALVGGAIAASLFFVIRKMGRHSVRLEASRWLAERQSGTDADARKWRNRGIQWSLWVPSLTVLAAFLFLPEVWGLLTHIQHPRAGELVGYQVPIPKSWVILYRDQDLSEGRSWLHGIAGRGMGFGVRPYLRPYKLPLSIWEVGTRPMRQFKDTSTGRWTLKEYRVVAQRDFAIGGTNLGCFEYVPEKQSEVHVYYPAAAYIECSGPNQLYAIFQGEEIHVPAFYRMLAETREVK